MKKPKWFILKRISILLILLQLIGCAPSSEIPSRSKVLSEVTSTLVETGLSTSTSAPAPRLSPKPTKSAQELGLTEHEFNSLNTLEKVDDYPLYSMTYYGDYHHRVSSEPNQRVVADEMTYSSELVWGCSLFAAFGDEHNMLYGRNFDWEYSPALLLFTNEPGALASVTMVDIAYLGFGGARADALMDLPLNERLSLLDAPYLPYRHPRGSAPSLPDR